MSGDRIHHHSSSRQVVCRLCDTTLASDLLPLHSHYCTLTQQTLLDQPPHPPHPQHRRYIDEYCNIIAIDLSSHSKTLSDHQRQKRQWEAEAEEAREELKAQLLVDEEEQPDDAMLDVCARMEQVMRDTVATHNWLALQHIFHSLKTICRRGFAAADSPSADKRELRDDLLVLARLCAAAIKQKMRAVASTDGRATSHLNDTPPLPRRHSASSVRSDPSTPRRVSVVRSLGSPDSAPVLHHSSTAPLAHPSSVPSSRSSRFNPSSRAPLSASSSSTPATSRPASPALILSSAPSLSHSISSPADAMSTPRTSTAAGSHSTVSSPQPVADYQQLSYELGRKALLHTYMRRSTSKTGSSKRASGRIGGSNTPSPPRVSHSPPPTSTEERRDTDTEQPKPTDEPSPPSNTQPSQQQQLQTTMKDFHFIRCLSVGGSSRVWLCEKRSTGDKYAVKVMRKHELLHRNNAHRAMLERHILTLSQHPHIVTLYYAVHSRHHLYLVLEYMRGGDLADLLSTSTSGQLSRGFVRSVLSEVLLSLEYLHGLGFVHRDVKPENIMLDGTGHVKLGDFGLSRHWLHATDSGTVVAGATEQREEISATDSDNSSSPQHRSLLPSVTRFSAVGTHNYLAPETVLGLPATPAIDWWALGVLAFHLLTGQTPFAADTVEAVMDNIVRGRIRWVDKRDERMGKEGVDLVRQLLTVDVKVRLGSDGADEIKQHPFFAGVDWDGLMQQKGGADSSSFTVSEVADLNAHVTSPIFAPIDAINVSQSSSAVASDVALQPAVDTTPVFSSFSHVPSSRARHSSSTSPSTSNHDSPTVQHATAAPSSQSPVTKDALSQPQPPVSSPPRARPHLLTSLPAFTASSEYDRYALSDTPSPKSPPKLASPSLPSYLTSLAPVTTDLSVSALSSFPSLSEASSSLLSSLFLSSSALSAPVPVSSPTVSSANRSSLDRLLSLTKPSALAAQPAVEPTIVPRPLSTSTSFDQPLADVAEAPEEHDDDLQQPPEQQLMRRSKSRDRSHAVKARRKISASAKIASRSLRSPYCTTPARPMRLSPPASFRSSHHRSPPAAASSITRQRETQLDGWNRQSTLSALGVTEWSSDADNGDADSDLDRVSEMRKEALQARKRKDLSRTSPTVQQREQRHYARKSPAAAARRVGGNGQSSEGGGFSVEPLSSDDCERISTAVAAGSVTASGGGMSVVLAAVPRSEYESAGAQGSPHTPPVPEWLLPASDESSEWSEFCSDFSERSDKLAGSASEGGLSAASNGSRAHGGSGVSSGEFASDWSVGSEDEVFDGFAWKNIATLQAMNEQVYQQMAGLSTQPRSDQHA